MAEVNEENSPANENDSVLDNTALSTICFRYIPLAGGASYVAFSSNVANPGLFRGLFGSYDFIIANSLWFNAHLGTGLYLYNSKHLRKATKLNRIINSVFGAVMFNFGSILFWAVTKQQLPKCKELRMIYCAGAAGTLLYLGRKYISHIDDNIN